MKNSGRMAQLVTLVLGVGLGIAHPCAAQMPPAAKPSAPRFYVVVRGVDEAPGVKSELIEEFQKLFTTELARHADLTLSPPADLGPLPKSSNEAELEAYKEALRTHHLRAVELTMRILEVTRALDPPPAGKPFRQLRRGVRLSVFGSTLPDKIMAIGGDGESTIEAEIRKNEDENKEGKALLAEAAKIAIAQAVDMTVTKLKLPPPNTAKKKPAKK